MPLILIAIGFIIIIVLVGFALVFGMIGAVHVGPKPSEGDKTTH
jgi:hypothetical protein